MSISKLNIEEFLQFAKTHPVLDVRSPGEFEHAHIPGSFSFPIFNDEERKIIGTAYKQESREKAIKLGLDFFGKDMVRHVEAAEKIIAERKNNSREIGVHCWRGGMRSSAMAWLLDLYGFKVYLLNGGYKSFRHWILEQFERDYTFSILGGYSGGNKTGVLKELKTAGQPIVDLEAIASHKGSAFGALGMPAQPSQEQFENLLGLELNNQTLIGTRIWMEAESQRLGDVNIPFVLYQKMRTQKTFFLDIPFEKRLQHILEQYGKFEKASLINGIVRIKKKLGGLETKTAINALLEDDIQACFSILLRYYDKLYLKSTHSKEEGEREIIYLESDSTNAKLNSEKLIQHVR
ncbi:tRNA 2-selenouridine(34) synthase MnmH [Sphingobacteriaceae bacterium]|nr:tRNA 2-selenouridine(34) synthase MnmH [Sphingobacteriaceae bacterium]